MAPQPWEEWKAVRLFWQREDNVGALAGSNFLGYVGRDDSGYVDVHEGTQILLTLRWFN
jgi:hypothetical protein